MSLNLSACILKLLVSFHFPSICVAQWVLCRNDVPLMLRCFWFLAQTHCQRCDAHLYLCLHCLPLLTHLHLPICCPELSCSSYATALPINIPGWTCAVFNCTCIDLVPSTVWYYLGNIITLLFIDGVCYLLYRQQSSSPRSYLFLESYKWKI